MGKLETYLQLKTKMDAAMAEKKLELNGVVTLQELNYRISVLQTLKLLCDSAPITDNKHTLCVHFELTQRYIECLATERRIGVKGNEEMVKKRQTAEESMKKVISTGVQKFKSYRPTSKEKYRHDVTDYIISVLAVWLQFRELYIGINV